MRMRAYRLACALIADAWKDTEQLKRDKGTEKIAGQLYAAIGSIGANPGEGYAHSSGRDRARIFEYALGSARESMVWYTAAEPILGEAIVRDRFRETRRDPSHPPSRNPSRAGAPNPTFEPLIQLGAHRTCRCPEPAVSPQSAVSPRSEVSPPIRSQSSISSAVGPQSAAVSPQSAVREENSSTCGVAPSKEHH